MTTTIPMSSNLANRRTSLPDVGARWIGDAGLETELIFKDGLDLPHFSAAVLLQSEKGRARLRRYYTDFIDLAHRRGRGLVLETATWRISPDWAERIGLDAEAASRIHHEAVDLLLKLRDAGPLPRDAFVVSGNLGPRYDGYSADQRMTADEAFDYHRGQIECLAREGVDVVSALTLTTSSEAMGMARAAAEVEIPIVLCFTVETDGRLPSGETLASAIEEVDSAAPGIVAYYGINCAHPVHFLPALEALASRWRERIGVIRVNASKRSHAELDESIELDEGCPRELAGHMTDLCRLLPGLRVIGGCCGTEARHVAALCEAWPA